MTSVGTASYTETLLNHHFNILINEEIFPVEVEASDGKTGPYGEKQNANFLAVTVKEEELAKLPLINQDDMVNFSWYVSYDAKSCAPILVKRSEGRNFLIRAGQTVNPFFNEYFSIVCSNQVGEHTFQLTKIIVNHQKEKIKALILPLLGENVVNPLMQVSRWTSEIIFSAESIPPVSVGEMEVEIDKTILENKEIALNFYFPVQPGQEICRLRGLFGNSIKHAPYPVSLVSPTSNLQISLMGTMVAPKIPEEKEEKKEEWMGTKSLAAIRAKVCDIPWSSIYSPEIEEQLWKQFSVSASKRTMGVIPVSSTYDTELLVGEKKFYFTFCLELNGESMHKFNTCEEFQPGSKEMIKLLTSPENYCVCLDCVSVVVSMEELASMLK